MPYVKLQGSAPKRSASRHGHGATNPNSVEVPTLTIADMLIQLTSHQQVITAEIEQMNIDILWIEAANKRYADVKIKSSAAGPSGSPSAAVAEAEGPSSAKSSKGRSSGFIANASSTIYTPNGVPITNAPANTMAVACFTRQIKELKALREERQAVLTEVRQHLALYQLHAPSGVRLLSKVRKSLGTVSE